MAIMNSMLYWQIWRKNSKYTIVCLLFLFLDGKKYSVKNVIGMIMDENSSDMEHLGEDEEYDWWWGMDS